MYLVYTPGEIVLAIGYCITCLRLLFSRWRGSLYLEGRMLDLRTDTELWSTLDQWGAPPRRACRRTESQPRGLAVGPGLSAGKDVIVER